MKETYMTTTRRLRARRGFTIIEMIVAMALMLTLIGLSTQLFRRQGNLVAAQSGRLDAQQNSRFAMSMLERELRVAGVGVADAQPLLVMANTLGITFNANLVSNDTGDKGSVYINPDADSAAVGVLRPSARIALPGTSTLYPDTTYMQSIGVPSNAETISYYLARDSASSHSHEYILWRRVNALPARIVARGIIYNGVSDTIFRFFKSDTLGNLMEIAPAALPIIHSAPIHGSQADTGKSALSDSIRQVRAQFTSVFRDPRTPKDSVLRRLNLTIMLKNAGLIHHATCGNAPLAVAAAAAAATAANGTTVPQTYITVSWSASTDDGAGEKDVERYAVYRRSQGTTSFDQPIGSVPAGHSSYTFQDFDLISGQAWEYGVTAQDCTPASSPIVISPAVTVP
jgi:prepilin-type N-terminal cleavage/methylation domain-containing protein